MRFALLIVLLSVCFTVLQSAAPTSCGVDLCAKPRCCRDLCQCNSYQEGICQYYSSKSKKTCMCSNDDFRTSHSPPGSCSVPPKRRHL
uniref:Uncharacterized protein n=1 Tax=Romanomermis culicivorax TaxID=13658 RepID=A0A915IYJ5_ROMCU